MTEVDIFAEGNAELQVGSTEVQDGDTESEADNIERGRDIKITRPPFKSKVRTGGQGNQGGMQEL